MTNGERCHSFAGFATEKQGMRRFAIRNLLAVPVLLLSQVLPGVAQTQPSQPSVSSWSTTVVPAQPPGPKPKASRAKETRIEVDTSRSSALAWLSMIVAAARAFGLDVLDSAFNNFRDTDGLRLECRRGRTLGFDGKTLIHPSQIETANAVFAPVAADVAWSRKIMTAFEQPENKEKGVINIDGRMVELLHLASARRLIALDEAIARLNSEAHR